MTTIEALIRQDLLTTEPSFVVLAPCPYDEAQGIATQLALAHDEVKRAKNCGKRIDTLPPFESIICLSPMGSNKSTEPTTPAFPELLR
ncbi:hypothetical protein C2G38_2163737 [Gigaspora rosea]|uniref:Uncharacterized protein n=1 Tax=Gigaspora rosea TaxID=44941 RepID=A0A397VWW7_9GLOM|nr:hypothetical protein C2G38_2163737 [Gigaspora rosea]